MRRISPVLVLCLCLSSSLPAACDEADDFGLPPAEMSRTMERLFAIPTAAYANAYGESGADMRPAMPMFTSGPNDGGIMKLALPTFSLQQTSTSRSVGTALAQQDAVASDSVMGDLLGAHGIGSKASSVKAGQMSSGLRQEDVESHNWAMGSQWLSLAQKSASSAPAKPVQHTVMAKSAVSLNKKAATPAANTAVAAKKSVPVKVLATAAKAVAAKQQNIAAAASQKAQKLHAVTTALSGAALSASSLASVEGARVKALAQARLKKKHNILSSMKREHTDSADSGPSEHGRKKANLDTQITGSSKWLAKAVMVLAIIAGTCICGGICGVVYCYRNRHLSDDDTTKIPTRDQQLNGKSFGRATPQYGSYGAKRR